ncbi:pollen receptor-like kinase 3 [Curcuma longa]|uniref:pollen receptor-like kinase 3 n=1 Tax=Curcuma longa TaxID=136217 RepID=UPI003D9DD288
MERAGLAFIFFLLIYTAFFAESSAAQETEELMTDATALLFLKDSFTGAGDALNSWSPSSTASPCSWFGVICESGIVTGLRLAGLGLSGTVNVTALAHFKGLRSISLNNNNFFGQLPPDLGSLGSLKSLFLSHNAFSGEIPDGLFASMRSLKKLWLNDNKFTGRIPYISDASKLIELRLEGNAFEGAIPSFEISSLKSFNVSNNRLAGSIPASLTRFSVTSFAGNPDLCGPPLNSTACGTPPSATPPAADNKRPEKQNSSSSNIAALVGTVVAVLILIAIIAMFCRRRPGPGEGKLDTAGGAESAEAMESAEATTAIPITTTTAGSAVQKKDQKESGSTSSRNKRAAVSGRGPVAATELIMINEDRGVFGLTDMMKATAEVLGNGSLGSAYKATMSAIGLTVVVKRMRDMNRLSKEAFDGEMHRLGTLRHPNVLTPLAYHYRKEEKLIVCEYVPKGSLRYILHGDTGAGHRALDCPTRLKIALGIARGMAYLHAELAALDVPHGNLKSANVLLGDDFEPLIADHGLASLVGAAQASQIMFAYRTPEGTQHRLVSPKSDVFCLGVVILELVTGKFPSQYMNNTKGGTDVVQWAASAIAEKREAELVDPNVAVPGAVEGMVRLLRVGAACANANPEERPEMLEVAELIEEIISAFVAGEKQS